MVKRVTMIEIHKGLNLPITGNPILEIDKTNNCSQVALLAEDYIGLKPSFLVKEGDFVQTGQPLFIDKKNALVKFTSPATGTILSINRGGKRAFESIIITAEEDQFVEFKKYTNEEIKNLDY